MKKKIKLKGLNLKDAHGLKFVTENFYGTVILKDWVTDFNGKQVQQLRGVCSVVRDEDFGVRVRGSESNWGIRVEGDLQQWTVLGCQIRCVIAHGGQEPMNQATSVVP